MAQESVAHRVRSTSTRRWSRWESLGGRTGGAHRRVVRALSTKSLAHSLTTLGAYDLFREALVDRAGIYMETALRLEATTHPTGSPPSFMTEYSARCSQSVRFSPQWPCCSMKFIGPILSVTSSIETEPRAIAEQETACVA